MARYLMPLLFLLLSGLDSASSQDDDDAAILLSLKSYFPNVTRYLNWSNPNPCFWEAVHCDGNHRVTRFVLIGKGITGTLPPNFGKLTELTVLELESNQFSGAIPDLSGLKNLVTMNILNNRFTSIPENLFSGMKALQEIILDGNPFESWEFPETVTEATSLKKISAVKCNLRGFIPDFLSSDRLPSLVVLKLSENNIHGSIPSTFAGSALQRLFLNTNRLNGSIEVLRNMSSVVEVNLQSNRFTGPIPDLSGLLSLKFFNVMENLLTGVVPASLLRLKSLAVVNLTHNLLQGPTPLFGNTVSLDLSPQTNSFCLDIPGIACDPVVEILLSVAESFGYPVTLAKSWRGNNPCAWFWLGITCSGGNKVTVVNLKGQGLSGSISPRFSELIALEIINLSNNKLSGSIPEELATLPKLRTLDVSNNDIYGGVPTFRASVQVVTTGNANIGKDGESSNKSSIWKKLLPVVVGIFVVGLIIFLCAKRRRSTNGTNNVRCEAVEQSVPGGGSGSNSDIQVVESGNLVMSIEVLRSAMRCEAIEQSVPGGAGTQSNSGSGSNSDRQVVEPGNLVMSIEVLRSSTSNFSEQNILGRGGFGIVYKGQLEDGTKIAVKRMAQSSPVVSNKGLSEFKAEITVLTKLRHRHLVALLGYCFEGNERLLVYEYMPQGTLSQHLFRWKEEGRKPLDWTRRLAVALDVARGVEYLHTLAHQSFIHRDLKPSNILLGDDMRAKVSDFGLVRLAPEGNNSTETRVAGTFGYLDPEYAVTGRVTTKVDIFSLGVILMELITGRKAVDATQREDSIHLVTWFRRVTVSKDRDENAFKNAIDPNIKLDEDTLASVEKVWELAGHCCAREPYQRPDMSHIVAVLSSLTVQWRPTEVDPDDLYGIDYDLPQAVKKWQAAEGLSGSSSSSKGS